MDTRYTLSLLLTTGGWRVYKDLSREWAEKLSSKMEEDDSLFFNRSEHSFERIYARHVVSVEVTPNPVGSDWDE